MGEFASGIAALPRIVTLHDIEIGLPGKIAAGDDLVLDVVAKTYRYLDEDEQVKEKPADQKGKKKPARKKPAGKDKA
jgi:type IV pilus assembly protein PilO